jgi:hypothetical protein
MKCDFIKKQTIKDKLHHNKNLMIDVNIDYPLISAGYDGDNTRFNMHYRQKAQKNYRYASTKLYQAAVKHHTVAKPQGVPFKNFEFVESFEPTFFKKPMMSLYYDLKEFTGGAHENTVRKGNTWDMKHGAMLTLDALFEKDYDCKPLILKYIESDARRRQITGMSSYFEGLGENLNKYYDDKNFYLTEEGLAIFYPMYTIAPYADGIQVFIVPFPFFGDKLKYKL